VICRQAVSNQLISLTSRETLIRGGSLTLVGARVSNQLISLTSRESENG
jgi:hypothetical protein